MRRAECFDEYVAGSLHEEVACADYVGEPCDPFLELHTRWRLERVHAQRRDLATDGHHHQSVCSRSINEAPVVALEVEHHEWNAVEQELLEESDDECALSRPGRAENKQVT